ncbi:MAG: Xaa-Pro peptidase family protein [Hyphomicrobiaceae bacterium]
MTRRYSPFAEEVFKERLTRARGAIAAAGLDATLVVALEHLYYFGGYDCWVGVNSPQALVFTKGSDAPTLIVRNVDLPLARETSWVADIRTYHLHAEDFGALVAKVLAEKGVKGGRVGVEFQTYALPFSMGRSLAAALAPAELVDTTDVLGALRLIKSDAEIALLTRAGQHAAKGLEAFRQAARTGVTEMALSAAVEAAVRGSGSDYWSIPVELASGERTAGGHGTARERVIEPGDLVHIEFAGVAERYHATAIQTLACGAPSGRARDLYRIGLQSLAAGVAAVRDGVPVAEVEEASLVPLRREGLEHAAMMRFGYGIGIAYPPIWLEPLQISRGIDQRLAPGMVFVLHSCLELADEAIGVVQGGTYVLERGGLRMLAGAGDVPLAVT